MPRSFRPLLFLVQAIAFGLAAAFLLTRFAPGLTERLRGAAPASAPAAPVRSYAEAVQRAAPAASRVSATSSSPNRNGAVTDTRS